MKLQNVDQYFSRVMFIAASILIVVAIAEAFIQIFGISLISRFYSPGRMMELAATLLIFSIANLLRQIRDTLRKH